MNKTLAIVLSLIIHALYFYYMRLDFYSHLFNSVELTSYNYSHQSIGLAIPDILYLVVFAFHTQRLFQKDCFLWLTQTIAFLLLLSIVNFIGILLLTPLD